MRRFLTVLTALIMAVLLCCGACFAAPAEEEIDEEALRQALGLTQEQLEALEAGTLDFNEVDLSRVDLVAVVELMGYSEEELKAQLKEETGIDLSAVSLSEIDVGAAVAAIGLTGDDLNRIIWEDAELTDAYFEDVDVNALMRAIGVDAEDVAGMFMPVLMETMGLGGLDLMGIINGYRSGFIRGGLISLALLAVILVPMAIANRKKKSSHRNDKEGD